MLRFLIKCEARHHLLQQYTFHQTKRTFAEKKITTLVEEEKKLSPIILKKLKNGLQNIKDSLQVKEVDELMTEWMGRPPLIPNECDIIIIGGGVMGSSVAYWLKNRVHRDEFKVIVIERDPMYTTASTVLSVGGLRQQFSLKENIEMSLFGAEFMRNINDYLGITGQPKIDPYFHPYGYLTLGSEEGAQTLIENSRLQNFLGAKNILLSAAKLKMMFPWLNTEDVELGCLGLEKEGWFDPWTLLCSLKNKAINLGVEYITAEAQDFIYEDTERGLNRMHELVIKTKEGETRNISFAIAVLAAGAFSGEIAKKAKIGTESGMREKCLPVEPRKRFVYCFHCPDGPGLNTPFTVDYSGTYFRREGLAGAFVCGKSPEESEEPSIKDLTVDYDYFDEKIWPILAHRVPAFEKLKLKASWAGYYEFNTFDQNGIIGQHPYYSNLFFATGFSGHGIQQAPAVGRAISELILDGKFMTLDLRTLSFHRFVTGKPVYEVNIV